MNYLFILHLKKFIKVYLKIYNNEEYRNLSVKRFIEIQYLTYINIVIYLIARRINLLKP